MTTASAVVSEARSFFQTTARDEINTLSAAISTTNATTFTVTYESGGIDVGALIAIDLELMLCLGYVAGTKTATVVRGWEGSTAATHANGAVIYVNPRVADFHWLRHLNGELKSLSSPLAGLFKPGTLTLTYNSSTIGYNLTAITSADAIINVLAEQSGAEQNWIPLNRRDYDLQRNLDTGEFASGFSLRILNGAVDPGRALRVVLKQPFVSLTALSDDVETVSGLSPTALDVVALGMAIRAAAGRELARNFTEGQGDTRRATEVQAGAVNQSAAGLRQLYRDRRQEEAARLVRQYGL